MKKIFKLMPVALAAFALASCNSDDLFGSQQVAENFKATLDVTVEEPINDDFTRGMAYPTISGSKTVDPYIWENNDVLRVYDASAQKYDNFTYSTTSEKFGVKEGETQLITDGGAENSKISYAGWKRDATTGTPVALVYIPTAVTYGDQGTYTDESSNTHVTFKAPLPMWGDVTMKSGSTTEFTAPLKWLTGYAVAQFNNGKGGKVTGFRARSLVRADKSVDAGFLGSTPTITEGTAANTYATAFTGENPAPLAGWFDAQLKTDGILTATEAPVEATPNNNVITVSTGVNGASYDLEEFTSYVYIPIIAQTYDILLFEYCVGDPTSETNWHFLKGYQNQKINRGTRIAKGMVKDFGQVYQIEDGVNPAKVTAAMKENNTGNATSPVILQLNAYNDNGTVTYKTGNVLKTYAVDGYESLNTIYIPELNSDMVVEIWGATDLATNSKDLTIADESAATAAANKASGFTATFIFKSFAASAAQKVVLNTASNVALAGDFSNLTLAAGPLAITKVGNLTLGLLDDPITDNVDDALDIKIVADKTVTMPATASGNVTVNATTNALSISNPTDEGATANTVTINGINVTLDDTRASVVNINKTAVITKTSAATVNVAADVTTLNISKGVQNINLTNGTITNIAIAGTAFAANSTLNITSSGTSAINNIGTAGVLANIKTLNISSSFDGESDAAVNSFGNAITIDAVEYKPIYTAAQLAAVSNLTSGNAKLYTTVKATGWTSPQLNEPFDGSGLAISTDAPLFESLADGANVNDVNLTVAITTAYDAAEIAKAEGSETCTGALARTAAGTVTVKKSTIAGTITAPYYAGGIIGKAAGTALTFGDGTAANKVTSSVTFVNNHDYGNDVSKDMAAGTFGKFVGACTAGTVEITKECAASGAFNKTTTGADALKFSYNRTDSKGKVTGYFKGNDNLIGYSTTSGASLTYGEKAYLKEQSNDSYKAGLTYDAEAKTVTGTLYVLSDTELTEAMKTAIQGASALNFTADEDTDWSGVTFVSHNHYVATVAEVQ